jgi:hypothetical protein
VPGPGVPAADSANLTAVAMASPSLGWASGFTLASSAQNAPFEPLLAAWDGRRWRAVPVGIAAAQGGRLDGLAVRSVSDAWAVGAAFSAGQEQPLALHWNGRRWALVPAAGVPGYRFASLLSVAVRSASDAWAVGEEENSQGVLRPLIEHWDGHRWRLAQAPDAGPQVGLDGVAVTGGQAWAVGTPFINSRRPVVLRWTGRAWVVAAAPESSGDVALLGVTAVNSHDAWAVGTVTVAGGPYRVYTLHWDGRRWAAAGVGDRGPAGDDRQFQSVAAIGGGRLAAVGTDQGPAGGGAVYGVWNGRAWSVSLGPLGQHGTELNAVAFDGRHAIWAVGSVSLSQLTFRPVVQVNQ